MILVDPDPDQISEGGLRVLVGDILVEAPAVAPLAVEGDVDDGAEGDVQATVVAHRVRRVWSLRN